MATKQTRIYKLKIEAVESNRHVFCCADEWYLHTAYGWETDPGRVESTLDVAESWSFASMRDARTEARNLRKLGVRTGIVCFVEAKR